MSARLKVETGLTAGTIYWIEKRVTRIGSGTETDVCLPSSDLPTHAATLEFFSGQYRIHNRTRRKLRVDTIDVDPDQSTLLVNDQAIVLADDTRLVLEIDGDPSPTPRPVEDEVEDYEVDNVTLADQEAESRASQHATVDRKSVRYLFILIACAVGCYFVVNLEGSSSTAATIGSPFDLVVRSALQDKRVSLQLMQRLRFAEAARLRQDVEVSGAQFARIYAQLIARKPLLLSEQRQAELDILNYVQPLVPEVK